MYIYIYTCLYVTRTDGTSLADADIALVRAQ